MAKSKPVQKPKGKPAPAPAAAQPPAAAPAPKPPRSTPIDMARATALASMGATDAGLARGLGISLSTLKRYRAKDAELDAAIANGKEQADLNVISALYKKAVGETIRDKEGNVIKTIPSDTIAAIFWLKNRRPLEWRDRREIEATAAVDADMNVDIKITVVDTKG